MLVNAINDGVTVAANAINCACESRAIARSCKSCGGGISEEEATRAIARTCRSCVGGISEEATLDSNTGMVDADLGLQQLEDNE